MQLVLPIMIPPGCREAQHITDLWRHPLLKPDWQDIVSDIRLYTPQVQTITTGPHGPIHSLKNLVLITLSNASSLINPPRIINWRPTFLEVGLEGHTLALDTPPAHRWKVHRLLGALRLPQILAIDPPKPSVGSGKSDNWCTIYLHFAAALSCALEREMILRFVKEQLREFTPLLGWLALIRDADALLLETTSTAASQALADLCTAQIPISPSLTLISTNAGPEIWTARLTQSWTEQPLHTGEKVRYRPSLGIEGTFATISALPSQIAGAKARKGHALVPISTNDPLSLQATLNIPLGATHNLNNWTASFFEKLAVDSSITLTRAVDDKALGIREWRPLLDYEGKWSGRLIVQCADECELRLLHDGLHGKQVSIGEHSTAIGVHSDFANFAL